MQATSQIVDRIVREVLRRLADDQSAPTTQPGDSSPSTSAALELTGRVISLQAIDGLLDGIQQIRVPHKAVVTPSVRDVLRERRIQLVRARTGQTTKATEQLLLVASLDGSQVENVLQDLPCRTQHINGDGVTAVTSALADALGTETRLAAIFTTHPEAVACAANRHAKLRAVAALSMETAARAVSSFAANVLVTQPSRLGLTEMRHMLREFVTAPRHVPAEFASPRH